ncbi:hypothetical protein H1Z61_07815 [Bacillus aquiflavi]|uniref:Uncharacterized protein n=2 Tax=Bacillus aquiflavi TaxID=2672567 RepID=A0A6B3VSV6_9BACI|nr:hypothetical protein [Bacillus aquiflavi]MBA4537053.1 hypothetical protein [Bacillus aquiflavi]NEY81350.1 hypothetical protein [Bacillus aquiflavi]
MSINVKDLIDLSKLGNTMLLVEPPEAYTKFVDGERTDEIEGYKYSVVLVDHNYDKIQVKVEEQTASISLEKGETVKVQFENLEVFPFSFNNRIGLSFKAKSVHIKK